MNELFQVSLAPHIVEQLTRLHDKAPTPLARMLFLESLEQLHARLQTAPEDIGEPAYKTRRPGGVVHKAVFQPLSIQFAVYRHEKVVLLFDIRPMPHSYLD